ncbi:MAG: hypothetical protein C6W55_11945 [Thermobacillus sp.]|nr:MAG: hypothetical protein C6W55_11945 [Thermobacillus sp.]
MNIPDYFLRRPALRDEDFVHFERLYRLMTEQEGTPELTYDLSAPKWMFLSWLCETKNIVLHGSANPAIAEFEPRQSNDVNEFGNRRAVYAASDGIWPIYFAIVDRERVTSLLNGCFRIPDDEDGGYAYYYYFSVDQDALPHFPWKNGMIYLLPRDSFEQQAPIEFDGTRVEMTQWASPVAVRPIAKLAVEPDDFPFLCQVEGHDPALVAERAKRDPDGFPWRTP